ncbi:hypothetical protein LSH36_307g03008 [Paralvinella palmiformis]|uniref:Uncharacterized protein n=1 Tax=Paralvinella palmiformis TaxID=53620 RepID=A0AAD9JIL8_9ANNE|nr:hypothetical protein LSH36_307g03008 [Paralvinella palmiformis]
MLHLSLVVHYTSQYIFSKVSCLYATSDNEDTPKDYSNPVSEFPEFENDSDEDENTQSVAEYSTSSAEIETVTSLSGSFWYDSELASDPDDRYAIRRAESRETYDPEGVFGGLFTDDGSFDFNFLSPKLRGRTLKEVVSWCDVDHYNLMEKAVIYNSRTLVRVLLSLDDKPTNSKSVFGQETAVQQNAARCFRGAIHLAAFLGCVDILGEFLKYNPATSLVRGPVYIRPVQGPPNDLFRIIGYSEFTKNPRLAFQMRWVRSHPNELPVHYSICGGYPIIMKMLTSCDLPEQRDNPEPDYDQSNSDSHRIVNIQKDALLANLVRQAASCASYNCLEALYGEIPGAIYARDKRGWLYISAGFPHGIQFVKFLMERGFAIKLLNNIDGKGTVNALHIFYNSFTKSDGTLAKFTDLYDVSEMLLDLSVDVNMETTVFRSHNVSDTALHILLDHLNLPLSSVITNDSGNHDSAFLAEAQEIYDSSMRDTIYLLLENGFDVEKHCYSLLKRLFMNRNFVKRYSKSSNEKYLVRANYGLRHVYVTAKLLLEAAEIKLCPARREITPALYLIDTLRDEEAVHCVFGDRRATQVFNSCLKLLFDNGDNVNVYPFFSNEDSYMASPLLHLCDVYINHWCRNRADNRLVKSFDNFVDTLCTVCDSGARFTCYMYTRGNFFKHGVYDGIRKLFVTIHRQLSESDQVMNRERLRVLNKMSAALVRYGAVPIIQEYAFRKSHSPMTRKVIESKVLGQVLLLGVFCAANKTGYGQVLAESEEYHIAMAFHLNLANHVTYYACLNHAASMSRDLRMDEAGVNPTDLYGEIKNRFENVRQLKHITRLLIYECLKPEVKTGHKKGFLFHQAY